MVDLPKLTQAIDAITDEGVAVDFAPLEKQLTQLTPQQREGLGNKLSSGGRTIISTDGKSYILQVKNRVERTG